MTYVQKKDVRKYVTFAQQSTNATVTIVTAFVEGCEKALVYLINKGTSLGSACTANINYSINAGVDGSTFGTALKAATALNATGSTATYTYETLSDAWPFIQVQIVSGTSSCHATVDCWVVAP